jgi:5-methylcytosine-specific restriction protein A
MAKRTKQIDRGVRDWYQLAIWRKRAKHQLQVEPFCRFCRDHGKVSRAMVADHHPPHGGDWNTFRLGPLQSLCWSCHSKVKKQIENKGFAAECDEQGKPVDPNHPAYAKPNQTHAATPSDHPIKRPPAFEF